MDGCETFTKKKLPLKEEIYSILEDEAYEHSQDVWKAFKLEHMSGYHDVFLKSDVLLLAAVIEKKFGKAFMENYKLHQCYHVTFPWLSWEAMLKMTKKVLELMSDINMYQFI